MAAVFHRNIWRVPRTCVIFSYHKQPVAPTVEVAAPGGGHSCEVLDVKFG